ncbi:response regulator [Candidatus Omnitrophota bacterium]
MFETVMVADGNVETRNWLYEIFSFHGYKVICVPNANEALLDLQKERPRLIVIDEHIKPIGGVDTIKRIREFDENIKIVLLTRDEPGEEQKTQQCLYRISEVLKKDPTAAYAIDKMLHVLKTGQREKASEDHKGNIMVVDDEQENRDLLSSFLSERGFAVSSARNGEEALMMTKMSSPHIVLLDIRMPGMDGLMVLKNLRDFNRNIKVVMLTAIEDKDIVDDALSEGACDYLVKPVDLVKLTDLVSSLLAPLEGNI